MRENTNQKNSKYGHFSRSVTFSFTLRFSSTLQYLSLCTGKHLIHFWPKLLFYTPKGFLVFSGSAKREHWPEMAYILYSILQQTCWTLRNSEINRSIGTKWINPFHANVPFLYPPVFSDIEMGHWREMGKLIEKVVNFI